MRLLPYVPAVVCVWFAGGLLPAAQDPLQAVFARLDKTASTFRGFTADMKRVTFHHILPDESDIETGKIVVRRVKPRELQMRIDIDPPNQKRVVVDGGKAEIYYPKTNTIQPVLFGKENKTMVDQFLLLGFGSTSQDLQSGYTLTNMKLQEIPESAVKLDAPKNARREKPLK